MSFISELLQWFEVKKPDFVKPVEAVDLTGLWLLEKQPVWFLWFLSGNVFFSVSQMSQTYWTVQVPSTGVATGMRVLSSVAVAAA